MIAKVLLVIAFVAVAVAVGIYCRRHTGTVDGFVLGGRNVGPWMTRLRLRHVATSRPWCSSATPASSASSTAWRPPGPASATPSSARCWPGWVLGPRTREMTHRLQARHHAGVLRQALRLQGRCASRRRPSSSCSSSPTPPASTTACRACSAWPSTLPYDVCVIGMAVVTCIYVVLGGYMATVMNDFIQGIVMLLGIIAVIVAVILNNGGFCARPSSRCRRSPPRARPCQGAFVSFFGPDLFNLLGVVRPHVAGHLGSAADGAEVLRHPRPARPSSRAPSSPPCSPSWWPAAATSSAASAASTRTRSSTPPTARPSTTPSSPRCSPTCPTLLIGLVIVLVLSASMSHAVVAGAHLSFYADHRLHQGQRRQEHVREEAARLDARAASWCSSPSRRSSRCSSTIPRSCSSPSSWATLGVRWPARSSAPSCGACTPGAFRRRACGARSPWAWV